jgi:putative endonuclease
MKKDFYVYIMTNYQETTFYTGVTSNLLRRVLEHKNKVKEGFSCKYNLTKLVHFETTESSIAAIEREKQLKRWHRQWKINLIKESNPDFNDLSADWLDPEMNSG